MSWPLPTFYHSFMSHSADFLVIRPTALSAFAGVAAPSTRDH
jgi:hypothetical protein